MLSTFLLVCLPLGILAFICYCLGFSDGWSKGFHDGRRYVESQRRKRRNEHRRLVQKTSDVFDVLNDTTIYHN